MTRATIAIRHTSALSGPELDAARVLVEAAFDGDFGADDWEHALGGMHVLVSEGDEIVGHGAVVQRRLLHAGRALRCGYIEAVAVRADRRRRGYGTLIMEELERIVRGAYDLGALSATGEGLQLYSGRGWEVWPGETFALTPAGRVRTEDDDGAVMVLPVAGELDRTGSLTCDWRDGDVW
jgi:aminoglycoside 2'-N-acetyltransferase I